MLSQFVWINGRSGRLQWWLTMVVQVAVIMLVLPLTLPEGMDVHGYMDSASAMKNAGDMSLWAIPVVLLVFWLGLVANIRRYHDRNKSGWWALFAFIPVVGGIWQFIELGFMPGRDDGNDYGARPRFSSGLDDEEDGAPRASGGLAKVDDAYLQDYARRLAAEQATHQTSLASGPSPAGAGSFGKRR